MADTFQVDTFRRFMPPMPNIDARLRLYYDETNNIAKLKLSDEGLNVAGDQAFVLAGIALRPEQFLSGWDELRAAMRIQASAREVKFKHVAQSAYEEALTSTRLTTFLEWLVNQDVLIHYSVLDPLYWAAVDIVDSLAMSPGFDLEKSAPLLKNELNFAVCADVPGFMAMIHRFLYPNVPRDQVSSFLAQVLAFVEARVPRDRNQIAKELKQLLARAVRTDNVELHFLHDNEPGELIRNFSINFANVMCVFKYATHTFDRETRIEEEFRTREICDGERRLDYRFVESTQDVHVQASDVVAGLIGRHFSYVRNQTAAELRNLIASLNAAQKRNLQLMRALIEKSDAYSPGLLHQVLPLDTLSKHAFLLNNQQLYAHLG